MLLSRPAGLGLSIGRRTFNHWAAKRILQGSRIIADEPATGWSAHTPLQEILAGSEKHEKSQRLYSDISSYSPRHIATGELLWHILETSLVEYISTTPSKLPLLVHGHLFFTLEPISFTVSHLDGGRSLIHNPGTPQQHVGKRRLQIRAHGLQQLLHWSNWEKSVHSNVWAQTRSKKT